MTNPDGGCRKVVEGSAEKDHGTLFRTAASSFGGRRGGMPVQYVLQATNIEKLQEVLPSS